MLQNKNLNTIIPDFVEKDLYEHVLIILFCHMKNILATTKVQFMENEITVSMKPMGET
jgi:hypothetical protein